MNPEYTREYNTLLADLTAKGREHKAADRPFPADSALWALARSLGPDAHLPVDVRDDMLADLWNAYDQGFESGIFDIGRVAEHVRNMGHKAEVVRTGGTYTLYCGRKVEDQFGEPRWAVSAGPCYHSGVALAAQAVFSAGADTDDGDGRLTFEPGTTAKKIARLIVRVVRRVEFKRAELDSYLKRVERVAEDAELAMWDVVAKRFPQCKSGDFDPLASHQLSQVIKGSTKLWVQTNFDHTIELPQEVKTEITQVPFEDSQQRPDGQFAPSLIHNGADWPDTFKRLLLTLVDERLADPEPEPFFPAIVYVGQDGDDEVDRYEGLIVERDALWLVFDDGQTIDAESVLSIHVK